MGSESKKQEIPSIDLSPKMERGCIEWQNVCKRVKDACEDYGCFEVVYDKISSQLRDEIFTLVKQLFVLPLETKMKNNNPKPYHSYAGVNLYEGFGIGDASNYDSLNAFAQLIISHPLAQLHFCKVFSRMMKEVDELHETIRNLIIDSYGINNEEKSINNISCESLVRVMKYKCPPPNEAKEDNPMGLTAHTDKPLCTLLCEHQFSGGGLQVQTKDGEEWLQWFPSPNSFIFIVGDPLMAWSNGRLHAVKHRVVMKGEKERYSFGAFLFPKEGTIIKPQKQLVDENNPQILKDFDYMEFLKFTFTKDAMSIDSAKQLFAFAGI